MLAWLKGCPARWGGVAPFDLGFYEGPGAKLGDVGWDGAGRGPIPKGFWMDKVDVDRVGACWLLSYFVPFRPEMVGAQIS